MRRMIWNFSNLQMSSQKDGTAISSFKESIPA